MRALRNVFVSVFITVILLALASVGSAKKPDNQRYNFRSEAAPGGTAPGLLSGSSLSSAATDTFHLAWFGFGNEGADTQGWTTVDLNEQLDVFFHVADATELDGGTTGALTPLSGNRSMWCGKAPDVTPPFCGYSTLPGYGNSWQQILATSVLAADSVVLTYTIFWDSEPGYDATRLEWSADSVTWNALAINDTLSATGGIYYDGTGSFPGDGETNAYRTATFGVGPAIGANTGNVWLRFRFASDGTWSDQDGLWPTDGAVLLDDITIERRTAAGALIGSTTSTFETAPVGGGADEHGVWNATAPSGYPVYADLYPGITVLQEDPCYINAAFLWGFFDNPAFTNYACHVPDPKPLQGAMPFGIPGLGLSGGYGYGNNNNGIYMRNEIWSPRIANVGSGNEYFLRFLSYRDLPLDNLQFFVWHIRSWNGGCPGNWQDFNFVYYGGQRDWLKNNFRISSLVSASDEELQIGLGAWDMCGVWCGIYGTGSCHSHAPLLDEVHLVRVNVVGPQFTVRHIDLFQDNFAKNGTLTGTARADMARDIAPASSSTILPGDSVTVTATNVTTDPISGTGPACYAYVRVLPPGQPNKGGANLEAPETRTIVGKRFPFVATEVHGGVSWYVFRCDSVRNFSPGYYPPAPGVVANLYAFDLNENVFTPGDTIRYFFAAEDAMSNRSYLSRQMSGQGPDLITNDVNEAASSPMEFTILPATGWVNGGDILYVDHADDRSGPPQIFFDSAFQLLGIADQVDRYDVLGPSSVVANSLASRVKNIGNQIIDCYRTIIWNSGNLSSGTVGDGTGNPDKSDDFGLLFQFLDTHPDNPGLYLSGDDIAQEWVSYYGGAGSGAINLRSIYMNFDLAGGNHVAYGEPVSPPLTAVGACFIHLGVPDKLIAYGGCPAINDFDILTPTGLANSEFVNASSSATYMISQTTPNANSSTARVLLSGFSYDNIRDDEPGFPLDRVEHLRDIMVWLSTLVPYPVGVPDDTPVMADRLDNAFPNPFNPTTTIRYSVKTSGHVTLNVYDVSGALVRTLVNESKVPQPEGFAVEWDGRDNAGAQVASGVYFYRLRAEGFSDTKKVVLLK